jgi:hypothetical protein
MWIVYHVKSGKCVQVYERESSAKSQVTRNNRELMMHLLTNKSRFNFWVDRGVTEWAYCSYADYEPHMARYYESLR